jgi:GT2 family glycosyltransferase
MTRDSAIGRLRLARRRLGGWRAVGWQMGRRLREEGLPAMLRRARDYGAPLRGLPSNPVTAARLAALRADIAARIATPPPVMPGSVPLPDGPLLSLIMPVFRARPALLDRAVAAVTGQSYPRWELCIVDDGSRRPALAERLRRHAAREPRIRLLLCADNAGIAAASNRALSLASGDYVGFLDQDDLLTHDALEEVARTLAAAPDTDVLYSDECKIDSREAPFDIFLKPDWSPALLLSGMYLGHLVVYRRALVDALGGLRSGFDFSQDYDLALRATERTARVAHVERVLYCWRAAAGSAAAGGKRFARESNLAALRDALRRRVIAAEAIARPAVNRLRWRDDGAGASIVVTATDPGRLRAGVAAIRPALRSGDEIVAVGPDAEGLRLPEATQAVTWNGPPDRDAMRDAGATVSSRPFLIFCDDTVRPLAAPAGRSRRVAGDGAGTGGDARWRDALLGNLRLDCVGAVGPKLLYPDGGIRHAGLVTGVRGLVAPAFHRLPADSNAWFAFPQRLREVSALSPACLAMPAALFQAHGGFGGGALVLSLRLRAAGYRCLYEPAAELAAAGEDHVVEAAPLLRDWATAIARDPFWPPAMRVLLHSDSPEDFAIHPGAPATPAGGDGVLIVTDALPAAADLARTLRAAGRFVVAAAPRDDPARHALTAAGVTVVTDALLFAGHPSLLGLASGFGRVMACGLGAWPAARRLADATVLDWIVPQVDALIPEAAAALRRARRVWAGTQAVEAALRPHRADIGRLPPDPRAGLRILATT